MEPAANAPGEIGDTRNFPDVQYPIEIICTNRKKTVSIQVSVKGVRVLAPENLSKKYIRSLIAKRSAWIQKQLTALTERKVQETKEYTDGEEFTYLGKNYTLRLITEDTRTPQETKKVQLSDNFLLLSCPDSLFATAQGNSALKKKSYVRQTLESWYTNSAREELTKRTLQFEKRIGVSASSISIKNYKSRWGSCTAGGAISYNWRIIIAPEDVVDYVVVHELCHILEHNHSRQYWKLVENILPAYWESRKWLKYSGIYLHI